MTDELRTEPAHFCGVCNRGVDRPSGVRIVLWVAQYLAENRDFVPLSAHQKVTVCGDCEERLRYLVGQANQEAVDEEHVQEAREEFEPILDDLSLAAIYVDR